MTILRITKELLSDGSGPKKTGPGRALDPGLRAGPGLGLSPDPSPIDGSGPKKSSSGRALDPGLRAGPGPGLSPDPSLTKTLL